MYKAKVLLLGPAECGKTVIANALSESTEPFRGGEYRPTQGCRILEFEVPDVTISGKSTKAEIELWDCSGDHKFETCWPAIAKDASGIVFVSDATEINIKDLESWYNYFVDQQGLRDTQCMVFIHNKQGPADYQTPSLSGPLSQLTCVNTSLEEDGDLLKRVFCSYLGNLVTVLSERREQDELTILDSR